MNVDPVYEDERFAVLYDALNEWSTSDDFYLDHVMSAGSVLDVGCGTGALLCRAREAGHPGHLTGADPATGMLAVARGKRDDVEWIQATAQSLSAGRRFDLVCLTGHAFQVFRTDAETVAALRRIHNHLVPGASLLFETRNPAAREWEQWRPDDWRATVQSPFDGEVEVYYDLRGTREPDLVDFVTVFAFKDEGVEFPLPSTLRFVDPEHLRNLLEHHGFEIEGWWGDWDRSPVEAASPEIVVMAKAN